MKNKIPIIFVTILLLSLTGGPASAAGNAVMTPEYAAKRENFRKQHEQRVTDKQRKTAAEALKAKRMEVYKAKQAVKHSKPQTIDAK